MEKNQELSKELAVRVEAEPRQCYKNSALAMFVLGPKRKEVVYVEGYLAILNGQVFIEHGWLEVEGAIVDVTLPYDEASCYHAVLRWTPQEFQLHMRPGSVMLPLFANRKETRLKMSQAETVLYLGHVIETPNSSVTQNRVGSRQKNDRSDVL